MTRSKLHAALCAVLVAWLFVCTLSAQAQTPQPTPGEDKQVSDEAWSALFFGDFAELERLHAEYQRDSPRTASGVAKLSLFRAGLDRVFDGPRGAKDSYFQQMDALTRRWADAHPESALAHSLHAEALKAHAWSYRGTGFAKSVPPEAWRDFESYIKQSIEYLALHIQVAQRSSSTHVTLIQLGLAASWDKDRLWAVAEAGLGRNPEDDGLYSALLNGLLPKWGGSAVLVDRLINDVVRRTQARYGEIFYARMYTWASNREFEHRLFVDSGASWSRMKVGLEQLVVRYPTAENHNTFARFACLARDKPALLDMLDKVGNRPLLEDWGRNASRTYETCKRWAAEQ
ncbi:MAG: DUF4034 domain-containing protein [Rubrivivax sp.]|nr:DUF4034 domain-containing protein [Rubrivivax sp.]MDP3225434.1 DUF4034 domain-containing protein [Rubrivivax sp.]MDP3612206.1 DUF4034 domain-containing protein [Rubrivivax sp.]